MVYCTKCGEQNEEDRRYCKNCGEPLYARAVRRRRSDREMCFGVPMAGYTWGLLIGLVIVLWGASELLGIGFNIAALFAVAFGLLILWNVFRTRGRAEP